MTSEWKGKPTFLSGELSEAQKAEVAHRKREIDRLSAVVDCWIDGYQKGEVALESMTRGVLAAARHFDVGVKAEEAWLGRAVRSAVLKPPAGKGRKNGVPSSLKSVAPYLVARVLENEKVSRKPARHEPATTSVYERVAEIIRGSGYPRATARMVEKWCDEYPESSESVGRPNDSEE